MADEPTREQLAQRAAELDVEGRSSMSKDELAQAVADAEAASTANPIPATEPQESAEALEAVRVLDTDEPSPDDVVGRPPLIDVAQERAANRNPRVIGAPTQEG